MNLGLANVAKLTHFIPEETRHKVRDWLISVTTPKTYRPPVWRGKCKAPLGINEYGFIRAQIGLAQGARCYARGLEESQIPFTLVNVDYIDWMEQNDHTWDGKITPRGKYAINLMHINADQMADASKSYFHRDFDNHYNIGVWLWELETLPASWQSGFAYVDELWVPSQFIAEAIRKETEKPVTVIPYGIETPVDGSTRADFGLSEDDFLVLAMYDSRSYATRKNPEAAIRAFQQAFSHQGTRARLVLKVANGKEKEIQGLKQRLEAAGIRYHLVTEKFEKPKLNALIACCDVFISLHRSEGFGLVVAEAMNLGLPVVATAWSANAEFMPEDCTCRVGYTLIPVGDDYQFGDDTQRWADPDVAQAAEYLRLLYDHPERAREMGEKEKAYIQRELSPEACGRRMRERYEEICAELRSNGRI
ncbi:MAG: glycosyltransferase family 4 protein [Clostridia bacterium]|nr:glycosyltransferase family 4 protein [Clostridia bacterium]